MLSLPLCFFIRSLSFSPVPRLGHVLFQALAQRVKTTGRGEPAGAELEAQVLEGERAHGRSRGGESVGVVHFRSFFVSLFLSLVEEEHSEAKGGLWESLALFFLLFFPVLSFSFTSSQ